jgi:hypothetical protein
LGCKRSRPDFAKPEPQLWNNGDIMDYDGDVQGTLMNINLGRN